MMRWHKVEVPLPAGDFVLQIKVAEKKLCLVKDQGKVYAVQNNCPHAGGVLSGGWCKNGNLVCPIHRWEYHLETGRGAPGQGDYIEKFPVEVRPDGTYIGLKEGLWKRFFK